MSAPTNLHRDLGRIEGKLDAVIGEMRRDVRRAHTRLDAHDGRLNDLEGLKPLQQLTSVQEKRLEVLEDRETRRGGAWGVIKSAWAAITVLLATAATLLTTWVLKIWGVQ